MTPSYIWAHLAVPLFHSIEEIIDEDDWHSRAGRLGAEASLAKYGNPGTADGRRAGGLAGWQMRRDNPRYRERFTNQWDIERPQFTSQLAELIGIMLGDGCLQESRATVTLNRLHENEYSQFVANLFMSLFGITVSSYDQMLKSTRTIQISSIRAVEFLCEAGLVIGNKTEHQVGVPGWILASDELAGACIRGLMDTDGGLYPHIYQVSGKVYRYVKLSFSNHSYQLLADMTLMLKRFGFRPTGDNKTKVTLNHQEDILHYYTEIGTHNPYHLERLWRLANECWSVDLGYIQLAP